MDRCVAGEAPDCYWLAQELQGADAEPAAVGAVFQRACALGMVSGCTNRAAGLGWEPATFACQIRSYERGCAFDDPWACAMLGLHLARGYGVERDPARALDVLGRACRFGGEDSACRAARNLERELRASGRRDEPL